MEDERNQLPQDKRELIDETIKTGRHIIMDIDVFGKKKFDMVYPEAIGIFIKPPSSEELQPDSSDKMLTVSRNFIFFI